MANAFKVNKKKDYNNRVLGYTHSEFLESVHNPLRTDKQRRASEGQDPCKPTNHICCGLIGINHSHSSGNGLWNYIYISYDNKAYVVFNVLITMLCLVSSYYYASLVGFRYSSGGEIDVNYEIPTIIFESLFLVHMLSTFLLEYKVQGEKIPIRDPFKIWNNYLNTTFPLDLLCLLPLQFITMKRNRQLLFFMIKMLRINKGFSLFDVHDMMVFVKKQYHEKT